MSVPAPGGVSLRGKTVFITGASRGIGRAIALRCAREGANVVIAAKTSQPHPKLPGTIHTVAAEVVAAGGHALPLECDVRVEEQVQRAVEAAVERFGGIDILVNNASAIWPRPIQDTPMKRYDLIHTVNGRATFLCSQVRLPYLERSARAGRNPHVLMISPPIGGITDPRWFAGMVAYAMSKYNMSLVALGLAEELRPLGIAVNALWPRTAVATAAIEFISGAESLDGCRKPEIMADAAFYVLSSPASTTTGGFFIDDSVLLAAGVSRAALEAYAVKPGAPLVLDYFVDDDGSDMRALRSRM